MPEKKRGGREPPAARKRRRCETAAALQRGVDAYFAEVDRTGRIPSEYGLALFVGVPVRTLERWRAGEERPELRETAALAYDAIADRYAQMLKDDGKSLMSFLLAALKQYAADGAAGQNRDAAVHVAFGANMDEEDLK